MNASSWMGFWNRVNSYKTLLEQWKSLSMDWDNVIMKTLQILLMFCGYVREFLRKHTLKYLREKLITSPAYLNGQEKCVCI